MKNILFVPKFSAARELFVQAYAASRRWNELVAHYAKIHGEPVGSPVSGVYNSDFPEAVRSELRGIAQSVTELSDKAWAAFPKRTRFATKQSLRQAVISRDGKGFYG